MSVELSDKIKELHQTNNIIKSAITDLPGLLQALAELETLIGMESFKSDVHDAIKTHIWNLLEESKSKKGRQHIIISGPPGCGKTTLAKVIAKIYVKLGYVKSSGKSIVNKICGRLFRNELTIQVVVYLIITVIFKFSWWMLSIAVIAIVLLLIIPPSMNKDGDGEDFFVIAKREDFVDKYVGGTAPRTKAFLNNCTGKVIFVDEAYNLINGTSFDNYGKEALTGILQYMDDHEEDCLFIFGGYKEQMDKSIFEVQPGLKRRFTQIFTVKGYTMEELADIFTIQLGKFGLEIREGEEYIDLFNDNKHLFPFYGGDTERLANHVKKIYSRRMFDRLGSSKHLTGVSRDMIVEGMKLLEQYSDKDTDKKKTETYNKFEDLLKKLES